jgi:hypothetical protein
MIISIFHSIKIPIEQSILPVRKQRKKKPKDLIIWEKYLAWKTWLKLWVRVWFSTIRRRNETGRNLTLIQSNYKGLLSGLEPYIYMWTERSDVRSTWLSGGRNFINVKVLIFEFSKWNISLLIEIYFFVGWLHCISQYLVGF